MSFTIDQGKLKNREEIINLMFYATNGVQKILFTQGETNCNYFFVIDEGECSVITDGVTRAVLKRGTCFGEKGLLHDAPRSATIEATPHSKFWVLEKKAFRLLSAEVSQRNFLKNRFFIDEISPICIFSF